MALTKVGPKYQVTIPKEARSAAGLKVGDFVEATVRDGVVVLRPKVVMDRDPQLERDLEASFEDVREGRIHGPFSSAAELTKALRKKAPVRRRRA